MSIILANFGKYAISDCPFILLLVLWTHMTQDSIHEMGTYVLSFTEKDKPRLSHISKAISHLPLGPLY